LFGTHVCWGADESSPFAKACFRQCQTKIRQDRITLSGGQDVSGFDVAVHHTAMVQIVQGACQLANDPNRIGNRAFSFREALRKATTVDQLGDDVGLARKRFPNIKDGNNGRMVQSC
jgi:hypothetical protein